MSNKRTNEEWMDIFRQRMESGLSIKKWCNKNDISYDTFKYWEKKLFKSADADRKKEVTFAEIPLLAISALDHPHIPAATQNPYPYRILIGKVTVDVAPQADPTGLAELIQTLQKIC